MIFRNIFENTKIGKEYISLFYVLSFKISWIFFAGHGVQVMSILLNVLTVLHLQRGLCILGTAHLSPNKIKCSQLFASVFLSSFRQGPCLFFFCSPLTLNTFCLLPYHVEGTQIYLLVIGEPIYPNH